MLREATLRGLRWVEQGAAIVGGCCEVGPAHIAALTERLTASGYPLTSELPPTGGPPVR